jgi:PAS domain S-box-containing protein
MSRIENVAGAVSQFAGEGAMQGPGASGERPVKEFGSVRAAALRLEQVEVGREGRRRADEQLEKMRAERKETFDAIQDSIMVLDSEFRIIHANPATYSLLGKPHCEIVGKTCRQVVHGTEELPRGCPLEAARQSRTHEEAELHVPGKDIWVKVSVDPCLDDEGNVTGAVHIMRDITRHPAGRRDLADDGEERESLRHCADVVENMQVGLYVYHLEQLDDDRTLRLIRTNPAASYFTGVAAEDVLGRTIDENFPGLREKGIPHAFAEVVRAGIPTVIEDVHYGDERVIAGAYSAKAFPLPNNCVGVTFENITDHKRTVDALRDSESKLRGIIEHSTEVFYIHGTDHKLAYVSPQSEEVFGLTPDEMMVRWTTLVTDNPINEKGLELTERAIKTGGKQDPYLLEIRRKDGGLRIVEVDESPVKDEKGRVIALSGAIRDVTARKKAEKKLLLDESRLEALLKLNEVGNVSLDTIANFALEEAVRLTQSEVGFIGLLNEDETSMAIHAWSKDAMDQCAIADKTLHFPLDDAGIWAEAIRQRRAVIVNDYNAPYAAKKGLPAGHVKLSRLMSVPIFDKDHVTAIIAVANKEDSYDSSDIRQVRLLGDGAYNLIQRKKAQNLLREMALLAQLNPAPVLRFDQDGLILLCNDAASQILGEATHKGALLKDVLPALTDFDLKQCIRRGLVLRQEVRIGDRSYQFVIRGVPDLGLGQIYGSDITDLKRAEDELCGQQLNLKAMASKILLTQERERRLLAVELHDNICQGLVLIKLALESSLHLISDTNVLASVKIACGAIGETIEEADSLTFALSNPVLHQLGFVAALQKYLTEEIQQKYGIECDLESDEHTGDLRDELKNCLFRVTRELLTNAVKHAHARKIKVRVRENGERIRVSVQDNGVGLKDVKAASAAPEATRFGLFSVREQLEYLGGFMKIKSKPGSGTTVTVVVPLEEHTSV